MFSARIVAAHALEHQKSHQHRRSRPHRSSDDHHIECTYASVKTSIERRLLFQRKLTQNLAARARCQANIPVFQDEPVHIITVPLNLRLEVEPVDVWHLVVLRNGWVGILTPVQRPRGYKLLPNLNVDGFQLNMRKWAIAGLLYWLVSGEFRGRFARDALPGAADCQ